MLPLRDNIPSRRFPAVTLGLIIINVLLFFQELKLGPYLENALLSWGVVPVRYTEAAHFGEKALPLFSSMFLHGGWLHLIGNMWVLWIFGDNVEDYLGHFKYILFYLVGGLAAALFHALLNWGSRIPSVGASGAIAAVMGAYLILYPRARVLTI